MPKYPDMVREEITRILQPSVERLMDFVTEQVGETHTESLATCEKFKKALIIISHMVESSNPWVNEDQFFKAVKIATEALENT